MSVGLPVTKQEIDNRSGDLARAFQDHFIDVQTLQSFLVRTPDADLTAMGYTADEVASLKTAYADLAQLSQIWIGAIALAAPKDFRTFVQRLWGVGAF